MTAPTIVRPAWVEELVAAHGEPDSDCTEPFQLGDRTRQCWSWLIGGYRHHWILLDRTDIETRRYVAAVGGHGRRAELVAPVLPTDDEMRALVLLGWGGAR